MTITLRTFEKPVAANQHIFPFNPARDLGELATLVEVAFGQEISAAESHIVRDMRQMAMWGPLLPLTQVAVPFFSGFVWKERGRLIGNVSLSQERHRPEVWTVSNVAVFPEYRRRGIAGQLMDTAIDHIRRLGGRLILLQVRSDNLPALALYRRRGFITYDVIHEQSLRRYGWPSSLGQPTTFLREVRARDWRALYDLVVASTPRQVLLRHPVSARRFRRGLLWQLGQYVQIAFSGEQRFELVGEAEGRIVAYGGVNARLLSGPHELQLYVVAAQRGQWELALVERLLSLVEKLPRHRVQARTSSSHPEGIETLRALGFETLRVLDQMAMELA